MVLEGGNGFLLVDVVWLLSRLSTARRMAVFGPVTPSIQILNRLIMFTQAVNGLASGLNGTSLNFSAFRLQQLGSREKTD